MKSLTDLAALFGKLAAGEYKRNLAPLLDEIGEAVKVEVKAELGTYQGAISPYGATAPLSPKTIEMKAKFGYGKGGSADTPLWREGDLEKSIQYQKNVNKLCVEIGSNEKHLKFHELGTSNEPPRPVLGPSAMRTLPKLMPHIAKAGAFGVAGGVWGGLGAEASTHAGGKQTASLWT